MIVAPLRAAFWIVGGCIGLIYGGVATAERPLLLSLVPDVEAGRFFSLMVLSSRAAAVVGPFIWALAVDGLTHRWELDSPIGRVLLPSRSEWGWHSCCYGEFLTISGGRSVEMIYGVLEMDYRNCPPLVLRRHPHCGQGKNSRSKDRC